MLFKSVGSTIAAVTAVVVVITLLDVVVHRAEASSLADPGLVGRIPDATGAFSPYSVSASGDLVVVGDTLDGKASLAPADSP